jgi:pyruvate formate lyase activating enzyme
MKCKICGKEKGASEILSVCVDCIRTGKPHAMTFAKNSHAKIRAKFSLPSEPPKAKKGISCNLCANECIMGEGDRGYCGLRKNSNGKLESFVGEKEALLYSYLDPLPTNCCSSWFCPGSQAQGYYNLAVFFYGCNFDCLFCQNSSHKRLDYGKSIPIEKFVEKALNPAISCICYFGGSPEPQLPFAIKASEEILERKEKKICWEWNGCGNKNLVKKAAELSFQSGGNVKFDLKTWNENLSLALSGVKNKRAYENFEFLAREFFEKMRKEQVLTATTLLVPYYVDANEVENIAKFISSLSEDIPYSLLVFHPDFYMQDLPITPRKQVEECYKVAKKYLNRVNIGNKYLLSL